MEWIETTAKTVEEAKELALDQLGVDHDDAEFDVVDEPKAGLFGRTRGEARVRARVRPAIVRAKVDRRSTRKKGKSVDTNRAADDQTPTTEPAPERAEAPEQVERPSSAPRGERSGGRDRDRGRGDRDRSAGDRNRSGGERDRAPSNVSPDEVGAAAEAFLSGLLAAFDLSGDIARTSDGSDIEIDVTGDDLGVLIGPKGSTLLALQDVTRVVSQRRLGDHESHLRIDVSGYRMRRREALTRFTLEIIEDVRRTGAPVALEPMASADRKVVHDTVGTVEGVSSRSDGEDPFRRVVIQPAPAND